MTKVSGELTYIKYRAVRRFLLLLHNLGIDSAWKLRCTMYVTDSGVSYFILSKQKSLSNYSIAYVK